MYDLTTLSVHDILECRPRVRALFAKPPESTEEAADRVVRFFRTSFTNASGQPALPLVRMFRTQLIEEMDAELADIAMRLDPEVAARPDLRCLMLLATAGDEPAWNDRFQSENHLVIPLKSERVVERAPMISQLILQMGFEISHVLHPDPSLLLDSSERAPRIFFVEDAKASPYIVAQDTFVRPYGVRSVVGFGWMMVPGDLYAVILFSRVSISEEVAGLLNLLGLTLRVAMMPVLRRLQLASS